MLWQSFKEFRSWFLHETLSLYVAWKKMDWQLLHSPERTLPPLCSGSINWCCLSCVRVHPKVESFNSENSKQFRNPRASNRNSSKHLVTKHSWLMTHILALHCRRKQFIMDSWVHDFSHRNHRVESFILTWSTPKFIQETAVADLPQPPHLSLVQGLSWANWLPLQDLSSYPTNVKTCYISTSHLSILSHTTHINTCWPSPQRTSLWPMTCEALKLFRGVHWIHGPRIRRGKRNDKKTRWLFLTCTNMFSSKARQGMKKHHNWEAQLQAWNRRNRAVHLRFVVLKQKRSQQIVHDDFVLIILSKLDDSVSPISEFH